MTGWERRGLLLAPPAGLDWAVSHAALPIAEIVPAGIRVYYSTRDAEGRSQVGRALLGGAGEAPRHEPEPLLRIGTAEAFDGSGVTTSCLVEAGGRLHLYYTGWRVGGGAPFELAVGCAVSADGGATFERVGALPILPPNAVDPVLTASPSILVEDGHWRMWYVSGTGWREKAGRQEPEYHIRYAESEDGIEWRRSGHVCVDYADAAEHAIARPCVIRDGSTYRMWFCSRGDSYRIGYAESADGLEWRRKDPGEGLTPAATGWDSEMMAYPWVFNVGAQRWLLYNGNGYGRTGIGLAVAGPLGAAGDDQE